MPCLNFHQIGDSQIHKCKKNTSVGQELRPQFYWQTGCPLIVIIIAIAKAGQTAGPNRLTFLNYFLQKYIFLSSKLNLKKKLRETPGTSASITYNCFTPDCFCQVEGERLLLVATHKRTAALNEISKLKTEGRIVIGKYTFVMKLPNWRPELEL